MQMIYQPINKNIIGGFKQKSEFGQLRLNQKEIKKELKDFNLSGHVIIMFKLLTHNHQKRGWTNAFQIYINSKKL